MYPSRMERVNSAVQTKKVMRESEIERQSEGSGPLPSALSRVREWIDGWERTGSMILLLDFDGTLAPIVERPELARIPDATRRSILGLIDEGATVAIVSGRGLADARRLAGLPDIAYAGNHGMEIEMPGIQQTHPAAQAARKSLEAVARETNSRLGDLEGLIVEDKGLTLSIHYRQAERSAVPRIREVVAEETARHGDLRLTEGKEVLEVRPDVDWHKGRAVEFLLGQLEPADGVPILYIGDDRTDEDAFAALRDSGKGEGVLVTDQTAPDTAAESVVKNTEEVARLLDLLFRRGN